MTELKINQISGISDLIVKFYFGDLADRSMFYFCSEWHSNLVMAM